MVYNYLFPAESDLVSRYWKTIFFYLWESYIIRAYARQKVSSDDIII